MEILVSLAMKFWMWSIVILVIIVGLIINLFDKKKPQSNNFSYKKMPVMRALPIRTKGKGFFKGILLWILTTRNW